MWAGLDDITKSQKARQLVYYILHTVPMQAVCTHKTEALIHLQY